MHNVGKFCYTLLKDLFSINRSLTGEGVRETLAAIKCELPDLQIIEVASGIKAFDWEVPKEWNVQEAYIIDPKGKKILDYHVNNLHLVGYSVPVQMKISLSELQKKLYSLPDQPEAIPYVTSYYSENWGFCISDKDRKLLENGIYTVHINSTLENGHMSYGEIVIPGQVKDEIFLSTYVCHPSMANNELSGPVVTVALLKSLMQHSNKPYHSIRAVFIPETIGSIYYISKHLKNMKNNIKAGFVVTCVGDNNAYSYMPTKSGNTITDRACLLAIDELKLNCKTYNWLERGSDERQYCAVGVDLPIASLMRSKYGTYKEYHTSLDDLEFVSPDGLEGAYKLIKRAIEICDLSIKPKASFLCEPKLSKYSLYPAVSHKGGSQDIRSILNIISYSDGKNDIMDISRLVNLDVEKVKTLCELLRKKQLLKFV
jgi:aminopeptidase-like protein